MSLTLADLDNWIEKLKPGSGVRVAYPSHIELELIRLARLGLWAKDAAFPALLHDFREFGSLPAEAALECRPGRPLLESALPKEKP